ncbi:hypothetical protein CLAFUW4_10485 [Fulvia fulva]|uniref:Uncharacterized protein n=1 Tax=Passalora fulva TaxID=5499 RepID=A0A9Q8LF20_PASFU|nr:uncharacterized protein CLAFUR5_05100 [Fulvia fulva]KAK4615373.1 hypothetical protein CLAFUR4_10488 [Fulvia fulva]KAK4617163.1 hypothetical protein CLAFUR0_10490 [Fulvia fulva]UJO16029.1 hypothetical protein CLAFUR5_05100 [Fulvia fulva]WPV19106.1 hypothetical protein CLAFUW4_10485 [Fulvia fulva]WPV34340.1 hypothetical protein CLAFUW7_10485 [Fulvia fulva]
MVESFHTGDPCDALGEDSSFRCSQVLAAHVYATAEKYQVPDLKELALEKSKEAADPDNKLDMAIAARLVYEDILLPEHDGKLHGATLDLWIASQLDATDRDFLLSTLTDAPTLTADPILRLLADRIYCLATMTLTETEAGRLAVKSDVLERFWSMA